MIPLKLTLKGIYSYREKQVIDFTRLTEANLFGIFGSVGSGKSTILEAISFALYGETERLNKRDDRNYNMMNLKSEELLIDFIFKAGDGEDYRFVVTGKRNKKHFETVGTFERKAYKKTPVDWDPVSVESATEIIGLSYENFRRTIIIPQNRFQEFLQLGDTERTRMMKDLFHLEKFELSDKVVALEKKNDASRLQLEARIGQIGEVTEDQIVLEEKALQELAETITKKDLLLQEKQAVELAQKITKDLLEARDEQQAKLKALSAQEAEIKLLESEVREYEACILKFKGDFDRLAELNKAVANRKKNIGDQEKELARIQTEFGVANTAFKNLKAEYENREELRKKATGLKTVIELKQLDKDQNELAKRIKTGDDFLIEIGEKLRNNVTQQVDLKTKLGKLKKNAPDLSELSAISNWFTIKENLHNNISRIQTEKKELDARLGKDLEIQKKTFSEFAKQFSIVLDIDNKAEELIRILNDRQRSLHEKIIGLEGELRHLAGINKLEEHASALKDGDPCPVCGSLTHPHLLNITDVKINIERAEKEKTGHNKQLQGIDKFLTDFNRLETEHKAHQTEAAKITGRLKHEDSALHKHMEKFIWTNYKPDDHEQVKQAFIVAEEVKNLLSSMEDELHKTEVELETLASKKTSAESKLTGIRNELVAMEAKIATRLSDLGLPGISALPDETPENIQVKIEELETRYGWLEKEYPLKEKNISELRDRESKLQGNVESEKRTLSTDEASLHQLDKKISTSLTGSGYASIGQVESIIQLNLNVDAQKNRVKLFQQELHAQKKLLDSLDEQAKGKTYDKAAHDLLLSDIQNLQPELDKLKDERGGRQKGIEQMKLNLLGLIELKKQLAKILMRGDDIKTLKQLFKASAFVNYVSTIRLRNLCNAANDRFHKLTRQKLQLEITETNNFIVRDFMNDGQTRSVKTLSGGQTFQAALCLALALADNIQQLTASKQNFFFLDEGFGSLDKESLQVVFDTLKTLRKENRIVGVISHVEEMQQEIDVYLRITNQDEEGSLVKASWE